MKTAVIVDDEQLAISELTYLLSFNDNIEVVNSFTNPMKALKYLSTHSIDVLFLDIQMPMKSGLQLAKELIELNKAPKIIFVTAYDTYAIEAFNVDAVDYILKPTSQQRLDHAVKKIMNETDDINTLNINAMLNRINNDNHFITLYKDGIFIPVRFENIIFCKAIEGDVTIHTSDTVFNYNNTLSTLEEILTSPCFFRCHRSYIINIQHIIKIEPTERTFLLQVGKSDELIPVSRSNSTNFKKIMSIY